MPRLEILGREAVEDRNNLATQRQKQQEVQDNAEYKRGMLKYYSDNLKLQAQQTDNEVEQTRLKQKAARFDYVAKVMDAAMKSSDPQKALMTAMQMFPEDFHDTVGDPDFTKRTAQLKPSGENQMNSAIAELLRSKMGGGTGLPQAPQPPMEGNVPGAPMEPGASPNASQATAFGGGSGVLIPKISAGGVDMVFPEDAAAAEANIKRAGNLEELKKNAAPGLGIIDTLETKWEDAFSDRAEFGVPIKQGIRGIGERLNQTPYGNKQASYMQTADAQMSMLVRALGEKGVLTNQDIARVKRAIPMDFTSKDLAKRNFQAIRDTIASAHERYLREGPVENMFTKQTGKKLTTGTATRKYVATVEPD